MGNEIIQISFGGINTLKPSDVWPNGDMPDNPTVHDVIRAIKKDCINGQILVSKWNLDLDVWVCVDGETKEVKFGF